MRDTFFRPVAIFDPLCKHGEGELLFSFSDSYFAEVAGSSCLSLDVREPLAPLGVLGATYTATYIVEGISSKLVIECPFKAVLIFEKPMPQASWIFVDGDDEKLLSHMGNHSLNMLASEFAEKILQSH